MKTVKKKVRIESRAEEAFADRWSAGRQLADALEHYGNENPVVLGIPRGGIVIAAVVAGVRGWEFDLVLARKIGSPWNPEFAIGAVGETGEAYIEGDEYGAGDLRVYVEQEKERQMAEIKRRTALYRTVKPKVPLTGRTVIVTDDGLATGATMQAALLTLPRENPARIVVAVPVAPEETLNELSDRADEIICLRTPPYFQAIGQFYADFEQLDDDRLLEILKGKDSGKGERW